VSTDNVGGESAAGNHVTTSDATGVIELGPTAFDFEEGVQYTYRVSASDPDMSSTPQAEFQVTIQVVDVNEAPVAAQAGVATTRMVEYSQSLLPLTDFSSLFTDPDQGDQLVFSLRLHDGVTTALPFAVSAGGVVTYTGAADLDYDDRAQLPSPWFDIVVTDRDGLTAFIAVRLLLLNTNFPPTASPTSIIASIDENVAGSVLLGTIAA